ncbi:MAG: aminotransferase class III-fold pyridoxal phosphate-dependent enzyme [Ignavibacteriae bacterium]|nr:MAG: aminotransferase class III-fold pyridoxal phosphate-dependent enzyme [Ignavibacteriota bacterium]
MPEDIINKILLLLQDGKHIPTELVQYLQNGTNIHFDNYEGKRLPYICVRSKGVEHTFIETNSGTGNNILQVIDMTGGYATACFGADHDIAKQICSHFLQNIRYLTDEVGDIGRADLLNYLFGDGGLWVDRFPRDEYHVSGRNSGSEGLELCLRLIIENQFDLYNLKIKAGREKRKRILCFEGAWHGWTGGILVLLNRRYYKIGIPTIGNSGDFLFEFLPFGNIEALQNYFKNYCQEIAGVIVEPILGDGGIIIPPDGYLRQLSELCRQHNVILAADEVLTYAKTGHFFAMTDEQGAIPTDITVIGKSLGLGLISTSLVIAKRELTVRASGAVTTSDLRPLTCSVIKNGIDYIRQYNLLELSIAKGLKLRHDVKAKIIDKYPHVFSEVRGKGILNGLALTEQASYHIPKLRTQLIENGIYVEFMAGAGKSAYATSYGFPVMRISPPLIITSDDIDEVIRRMDRGIQCFINQ